jgi:hypothetical protein
MGLQQGQDTCQAASHAALLGRPVAEASAQIRNRNHRIASSTGPITADYSESRLNIYYDERSRLIVGIKCG